MSLDVYLECHECGHEVFTKNITHNLTQMAKKAELYYPLWRPDEIDLEKAEDLIGPLEKGLKILEQDPAKMKKYNPDNGWGVYEYLVEFTRAYLQACKDHPKARIRSSR